MLNMALWLSFILKKGLNIGEKSNPMGTAGKDDHFLAWQMSRILKDIGLMVSELLFCVRSVENVCP